MSAMRHRKKHSITQFSADGLDRSDPNRLASLADRWVQRMEQRNYSPRTLDISYWALKQFIGWCEDRGMITPQEVTKANLESFQRWLYKYRKKDGKPLVVPSQINRLGVVQRFFGWLCREDILSANPAADLELPRQPAKILPKSLSREEINGLFSIPNTADLLGLRDRCILEVFYSCGLRRSELVGLDVDDVDACRGIVTVRKGKGGKTRNVPIGECALDYVERYLEQSRPLLELDRKDRALFLTGYGGRFSAGYLTKWVSKTMKAAGIHKAGSSHLLRHSCATHMLENGADIRFISQMLGHASIVTTQIYTEVSIVKLREVHARTHPRGKVET